MCIKSRAEIVPLVSLEPPVSIEPSSIQGSGKARHAIVHVRNNSNLSIAGFVLKLLFLTENGTIANSSNYNRGGLFGPNEDRLLERGRSALVNVSSTSMTPDTKTIAAIPSKITFEDKSIWPAMPTTVLKQQPGTQVSIQLIGFIGAGIQAFPAVGCFNHGSQAVQSVSYSIDYLDDAGNLVNTTSNKWSSVGSPLLPSETGKVLTGGKGPPVNATKGNAKITKVILWEKSNVNSTNLN